jgi:hypothetical protein
MVSAVSSARGSTLYLGLGIAAMGLEAVKGVSGNKPFLSHLDSVKSTFLDQHKDPQRGCIQFFCRFRC